MADITVATPAQIAPNNWLGTQLLARGTVTVGMAAQLDKARGGVGKTPLTCQIQKQADGSLIAVGVVFTAGTNWWARFGPLTNEVDHLTTYQLVATAPLPEYDTSVTITNLRFAAPNIYVTFASNVGTGFSRSFSVSGTYMCGEGSHYVDCYLLNESGTMVANGSVQMDTPQIGNWTANFNVTGNQSNCSLVVELQNSDLVESVAAAWIDGVSVTG